MQNLSTKIHVNIDKVLGYATRLYIMDAVQFQML